MTIKATVVIQKESKADPRKPPGEKDYYETLHLFSEDGKEYADHRYLTNFEEAGNLLHRKAGVSYEHLPSRKHAAHNMSHYPYQSTHQNILAASYLQLYCFDGLCRTTVSAGLCLCLI